MHFSRYARKSGRRRAAPAWWAFGLLLATAGAPAVSATAGAVHAPSPSKAQPGSQQVGYRGHTFTIPRTWRVIRLAAHPHACVRFDRHVLYLGVPGPSQQCPSTLIGTTEALLAQPAAPRGTGGRGHVPGGSPDHGDLQADRGDRDLLRRFRRPGPRQPHPGRCVTPGPGAGRGGRHAPPPGVPGHAPARVPAAPAMLPAGATDFTGQGFDACTAPSAATMQTWLRLSPYRAVGIYIGGSDRACAQPSLTASWVSQQQAAGWHFIPIYVGPQARVRRNQLRGPPGGQRGQGRGQPGPAAGLRPGDTAVLRHGGLPRHAERPGAALPDLVDQGTARARLLVRRVQQLAVRRPGPGQQLRQPFRHDAGRDLRRAVERGRGHQRPHPAGHRLGRAPAHPPVRGRPERHLRRVHDQHRQGLPRRPAGGDRRIAGGLPGGRPAGRGRGRVLQGSGRQALARLVHAGQRLARPGQPGRLAGGQAVRGRVGARQRGRVRQGHGRAACWRPPTRPGRTGPRCGCWGWPPWAAGQLR